MADDSGDKSEKASAQKLRKSRQEGQVVRSRDLATAIGILVSLKIFIYMLPSYLLEFREIFHQAFAPLEGEGALDNVMSTVWLSSALLLVKMVLPLFVVPLFIVLGAMVPGDEHEEPGAQARTLQPGEQPGAPVFEEAWLRTAGVDRQGGGAGLGAGARGHQHGQ
jgi:hypothetical protein